MYSFSSGVVSLPAKQFSRKSPKALYRDLGEEEESRVIEACAKMQTKLIIYRLFNASGRFVSSPSAYALSSFLYQGILSRRIVIDSTRPTWRRYVDLGRFIEVCDRLYCLYFLGEGIGNPSLQWLRLQNLIRY